MSKNDGENENYSHWPYRVSQKTNFRDETRNLYKYMQGVPKCKNYRHLPHTGCPKNNFNDKKKNHYKYAECPKMKRKVKVGKIHTIYRVSRKNRSNKKKSTTTTKCPETKNIEKHMYSSYRVSLETDRLKNKKIFTRAMS